jgi:hypothetical protein
MMMKKLTLCAAFSIISVTTIQPIFAQIDGDYLSDQIERRRLEKLRRDQQEIAKYGRVRNRPVKRGTRKAPPVVTRNPLVRVNGRVLQTAVPAVQRGSYTFVPMREIFEALGAKVSYNTKRQIVTAVRGGTDVQVKLKGLPRMDIQGTPARLSDAESPFVYNGTTMIPLRVVSQALGAKVVYTPHKTKPVISIDS